MPSSAELVHNGTHRFGGGFVVHRHPHHLAAGAGQCRHLQYRRGDVRRVGVGHRLHHDRRVAAYPNVSNGCRVAFSALMIAMFSLVYQCQEKKRSARDEFWLPLILGAGRVGALVQGRDHYLVLSGIVTLSRQHLVPFFASIRPWCLLTLRKIIDLNRNQADGFLLLRRYRHVYIPPGLGVLGMLDVNLHRGLSFVK